MIDLVRKLSNHRRIKIKSENNLIILVLDLFMNYKRKRVNVVRLKAGHGSLGTCRNANGCIYKSQLYSKGDVCLNL
jgi:hypothetical protein